MHQPHYIKPKNEIDSLVVALTNNKSFPTKQEKKNEVEQKPWRPLHACTQAPKPSEKQTFAPTTSFPTKKNQKKKLANSRCIIIGF